MAMMDYLKYYTERNDAIRKEDDSKYTLMESRCIELENYFFRMDETTTMLFEKMLHYVCWMGDGAIDDCSRRLKQVLRWTQTKKRTRQKHGPR